MTSWNGGAAVVVDHVSRSFEEGRISALVDVSFSVEPGEFVGITGPSGCGKSTLLNLIGALDRPTSGEIRVGGERVGELDGSRYRGTVVGFVFQFHNLIPTLTALENVQLPMFGHELGR
jgi:putative ABC transport system ATP-binding protein